MKIFLGVWLFLSLVPCFAAEPTSDSEFFLDKDLVNRLYDESVSDTVASPYTAGIRILPLVSYFSPSAMTLENGYFQVPYAEGMGGALGLSIQAAGNLLSWRGLDILGQGGVGYSFKEAVQKVYSNTGMVGDRERTARLTLHRLPISMGTKVEYNIAGFSVLRPFVSLKGGAEWLYQVGQLDGIEQGFWIPFYEWGAGLILFDSPRSASTNNWFGGMTVALSQHESFSSMQTVSGWVFDIGINLLL